MPKPVSRRDLIRRLKLLGFSGPFSGGKHEYMKRGNFCATIPNPHGKDISGDLVQKLLKQAGILYKEFMGFK